MMPHLIHQKITFPATPEQLFDLYLDSKRHGAAIEDKVSISRRVGSRFTAFGGGVKGRTLEILPKRMIVQSWRGSTWKKQDPDSILILRFIKAGRNGCIELIQANVPEHTYARIKNGWTAHYWTPWKRYLSSRRSR